MTDESWPMVEEAVFRLFDELSAAHAEERVRIGPRLAELGWSDIESEYPVESAELLFRAQGRSLAQTDALDRAMLAELAGALGANADHVLLPDLISGHVPSSDPNRVSGIILGPLDGRVAVPISGPLGSVSIAVVDATQLHGDRLDTFDESTHWTRATGSVRDVPVAATAEWNRALATAHRALATELVALGDQVLRIAVEHVSVRVQFGSAIGSFQSPRHALADASAALAGARALLGESWRYGGDLSATAAKAAAGRAHRAASDVALQVCGAIGLTAEHDLHRFVTRGFQADALCGSYDQLESLLGDQLFANNTAGQALPSAVTWS